MKNRQENGKRAAEREWMPSDAQQLQNMVKFDDETRKTKLDRRAMREGEKKKLVTITSNVKTSPIRHGEQNSQRQRS